MDDIVTSVLSELVAGLIVAALLGVLVQLSRRVGSERWQRWTANLRRLGWPLLAFVFFSTSLLVAILRGEWLSVVVFLLLASASLITLRFGSEKIQSMARAHAWQILAGIFFLSTVSMLFYDIICFFKPEWCGATTQLIFVVDLADEEMIVLRDVLDEIEPKLRSKVILKNMDSSYHVARLDKMVASDAMRWDLIAVDNNRLGLLTGKGLVQELSRYWDYDKVVPQNILASLHPLLKFDDRWYFAPFRTNVKITFYNEKKFEQYNLKPPRKWNELLDVARVFKEKEKEGLGRVAIQGYPGKAAAVTVFEFVKAAGGNPLTLDDDGSRRAFTFLQQLESYLAPEHRVAKFDSANELLIHDEIYLLENWIYGYKIVVEDAEKEGIKVYSGWKGPEREVHVLGGDLLAIPTGTPHAGLAVKLIELLLSKETQKTLFSRLRWLPVRSDLYDERPPELASYFQAVNEALGTAEARPTTPQWPLAEDCLDQAYRELIHEGKDIGRLKQYAACLKEIPSELDRYRVKKGDTLEEIARHHRTTVDVLARANGMTSRRSIYEGQILLIPTRGAIHASNHEESHR